MKVLVVDDDVDLLDLMTYALRREGYNVLAAVDGQHLAGDVGRLVGGKEDDGVGDLVRRAHALQRHGVEERLALRVFLGPVLERRRQRERCDRVDANGVGTVNEHRLYQLIRESGGISDHTFEIEFFDPGIQAYAFTFG